MGKLTNKIENYQKTSHWKRVDLNCSVKETVATIAIMQWFVFNEYFGPT